VIGGLVLSTLMTLYLIPTLYAGLYARSDRVSAQPGNRGI
jgi:Cu/Ag efflux pump CusA